MNRTNIINSLIEKNQAKKYLEIGVCDGSNFLNINCAEKVGVDPDTRSRATIYQTSDEFFKNNKETFDVIFIDGLHYFSQVYRDIINSLEILNDNGFIVCHDMNPEKEEHQLVPYREGIWNGDCWKAFVLLRTERSDLEMYTVDTDYGCSIIRKGTQKKLDIKEELNWSSFTKNKKEWLNLISVNQFFDLFNILKNKLVYEDKIKLQELLNKYVMDPENPETNYELGKYYEDIGQTASALSYYLRTAERTKEELLQYECLIRSSMCFDKQGCRNFTVKGLLQHALAIMPTRPEAYYLLSRFYEKENKDGSWQDCYTIASIGNKVADLKSPPLRTDVDYPGPYALLFQKAVSSWWCGLCEESRNLFKYLYACYNLNENFKQSVINNLNFLKVRNNFDWGLFENHTELLGCLKKEIENRNYEKEFEVCEGDIVVDIGASVGPFAYSILCKKPSTVICLEPHKELFKTLKNNLSFYPSAICLNKAISNTIGTIKQERLFNEKSSESLWSGHDEVSATNLIGLIKEFNLLKIDFLKIDCEGGEYDLFNNINYKWIKQNVKKIAGEWHLNTPELKEKFKNFRDVYLKSFDNYKVYFVDRDCNFTDITSKIWNDEFLEQFGWVNIYINNDNRFNWGDLAKNSRFLQTVTHEIFIDRVYEKFFTVEKDDLVVDVGASVGPFSYSILGKCPQHVFCLEPHKDLFQTLKNNLNKKNVTCINSGIMHVDGDIEFPGLYNPDSMDMWSISSLANGITFKNFIKKYEIKKIDFLKVDCEGGEYEIFNDQNSNWILENVKKVAGEWHLHNAELKQKFRIFRDNFLSNLNDRDYEVYSMDDVNIKSTLWSDWFIDYYGCIMIYMSIGGKNE